MARPGWEDMPAWGSPWNSGWRFWFAIWCAFCLVLFGLEMFWVLLGTLGLLR